MIKTFKKFGEIYGRSNSNIVNIILLRPGAE